MHILIPGWALNDGPCSPTALYTQVEVSSSAAAAYLDGVNDM